MRQGLATVALTGLVALVASPFLLLAGAFWLSDHTHEFGPYDPRVLLLVRGTTVDRLGLIRAQRGSIAYAARGQDGTSPARVHVTFTTPEEPSRVIETYRQRCQNAGLVPKDNIDASGRLECDGLAGDEIGITAERRGPLTHVTLGGWVF